MKEFYLKKAVFAGSYFLLAFAVEFITFNMLGFGSFPTYLLFDIAVLLVLSAFIYIVPSFIAQTVLICFLLAVQVVISVVNECLYTMSGYIFGLSMLSLAGEAAGAFDPAFVNFSFLVCGLLLVAAEGLFLVGVMRWRRCKKELSWQVTLVLIVSFVLSCVLAPALFAVQKGVFSSAAENDSMYRFKDEDYLYETQYVSANAFRKFGTFGYYFKNLNNFFSDLEEAAAGEDEEETEASVSALREYFLGGTDSSELEDLDLTQYGAAGSVATGVLDGQNIVLIVIESGEWYAINSLYTPTLYALANQGVAMTQYYARDKTNHSEAMSLLGSYPVQTRNCITPSVFSRNGLMDHDFAFTLPNILRDSGYTTNYFHANSGSFYGRASTFGDLYGFDHATFLESMDRLQGYYGKDGFYAFDRDSEFFSQYLQEFTRTDDGGAFFSMLMTITSHGSYNELLNLGDYTADMSDEAKQAFSEQALVKGLEPYYERIDRFPTAEESIEGTVSISASQYDENGELSVAYLRYKRYQASLMDLDVGVNRLLAELEESGELDNTTFVFYADHNGYYSGMQYDLKEVEPGTVWDTMLYNIPFFFWSGKYMDLTIESDLYDGMVYVNDNSNVQSVYDGEYYYDITHRRTSDAFPLGGVKITKFCNSFDLLPTMLDLLGYSYHTSLYQGVSVFDASTSVFISRESGMFNDVMYTDGLLVWIRAERVNGVWVSEDGQVRLSDDGTAVIVTGGAAHTYTSAELDGCLYVQGNFLVFDLSGLFRMENGIGDGRGYLSDSVYAFLVQIDGYYDKQDRLEDMYAVDYFRYASLDELVRKIV